MRIPSFYCKRCGLALAALAVGLVVRVALAATPTPQEILAASAADEWRTLDPAETLYMRLGKDRRVVIELAPGWAPLHVANIKTLVHQHYFDQTSIYRVQDNFVAQWGDADGENPTLAKPMGAATGSLPPEFTRAISGAWPFTLLPDGDLYAPEVGFSRGLPVARDPKAGRAWLVQCYGMVGVARSADPTSGNGNTLYVPIGQAPRQIDHQLAVVGRVVSGMQWLSSLPRGPEPTGFYKNPAERTPILSMRLGSALPPAKRMHLQVLRTDSQSFARLVEAKRNRKDDFYTVPVGHIGICNVPLPVREVPASG